MVGLHNTTTMIESLQGNNQSMFAMELWGMCNQSYLKLIIWIPRYGSTGFRVSWPNFGVIQGFTVMVG